jgi:methylated-DNA-[protein]-cysteine S-methyltransferase
MTIVRAEGWTIATPVAPLSVITDDDIVIASGFCELEHLVEQLASEVEVAFVDPRGSVAAAVRDYLGQRVNAIDRVQVRQRGSAFMQEAWRVMREIPAGQTWSYRDLATKAGSSDAVRAAGSACARNLVAPFVPCHRVLRSDGTLGGYAYGLDVKRWLLAHEGFSPTLSPTG